MSEFKGTPGKWEISSTHDENLYVNSSTYYVALVFGANPHVKANARLIAAAPELLQFLFEIEQWEANLILDQEAWDGGVRPLPQLTEGLWDQLMKLQSVRNKIKSKALGKEGGT